MRTILLLALFGICIRCTSNTKTEETPHLFADFYVRYLQTERQIKAHASFLEGDTLRTARAVQFNSSVTFQGNPMVPRQLPPNTIRYIYNGEGDYAPDGFIFQYQDLAGATQQHVLQMAPIEDFSVSGEASRSQGLRLTIQSAPFQENESLVLLFTNSNTNQAFSLEYKGIINQPLFVIPGDLQNITPGKYLLYLVKKQLQETKTADAAINASIEFYTKTIEIQIAP